MVVNYIHSSFSYPCPHFCEWNSDPPSGWNQNISPGIPPSQSQVPPLSHYQASTNLLCSTPKPFWLLLTAYLNCFPGSTPSGGPTRSKKSMISSSWKPLPNIFLSVPGCLFWSQLCPQLLVLVNASSDPCRINSDVLRFLLYLYTRERANKRF